MKKNLIPTLIAGAPLLLVLGGGCATHAQDKTNQSLAPISVPPDDAGITDAQIQDVIARVAKHQIQLHPIADGDYPAVQTLDEAKAAKKPQGIQWNYPWGVTLSGMIRSTDATGDKSVEQYVTEHDRICANYYDWLAGLKDTVTNADAAELKAFQNSPVGIGALMKLGSLDSCGAMGAQFEEVMLRYPGQVTQADKDVDAHIADWIVNRQERLPDGTLCRGKQTTVWPDDLYMSCPFLIRYAKITGNTKYLDDAANQIIHQAALEQDTDGLFFHGYNLKEQKHSPFKWGRGNGWVTVATVEVLSAMPENNRLRPQLLRILRKQISGLEKVQAPDGMWHQVLDHPELWEETSCTAMFAYGIARAVDRGWIDPTNMVFARKAFAGIAKNVTAEGVVQNTCEGTNIGQTLDYYVNRAHPLTDPRGADHGPGPVMLAGTEILMADRK